MCRFSLLIFGFWLAAAFLVHADMSDSNEGHLGSSVTRSGNSGFFTIDYVASGSPAAQAGIEKGDGIVAIDDISTQRMTFAEAKHFINGNIGGVVNLTVRRNGFPDKVIPVIRRSLPDTYSAAAQGGDATAEFYMGMFYEIGPIANRNHATAADWFGKAAELGHAAAQGHLGYMYRHGWGVTKNDETAVRWLVKGAAQGDDFAEVELGECYLEGRGVEKSDRKAFDWFYSAAVQGDAMAEQRLGYLYREGYGVTRNDNEAFNWYYRSAQQGDVYGAWGLAYMYEHGRGVKVDMAEAFKWYQKAEAGLPGNENLKKTTAIVGLMAFLAKPGSAPLDLSFFKAAFQRQISFLFYCLVFAYLASAVVLLYVSFRASDTSLKLPLATGWILFYVESQGVAFLSLVIFGLLLRADTLFVSTCLFSALPVIASSIGPLRKHIWKAAQVSWKTLLFYGVASVGIVLLIDFGYAQLYPLVMHSPLPQQPTRVLISKAEHESAWLAYATIALLLPLAEEILFRGYLFESLKKSFSGTTVVIITAVVFSLVHFQPVYFVPLFGFGIVLGWVKLKTGSLRWALFLHALNNGLVLAFAV